jgi:hypothetical protein
MAIDLYVKYSVLVLALAIKEHQVGKLKSKSLGTRKEVDRQEI